MPVVEALYVMAVASKTGWNERYIRWELPLCRGLAYYHAARMMEGERCRWPSRREDRGKWAAGIRQRIRELIGKTRQGGD